MAVIFRVDHIAQIPMRTATATTARTRAAARRVSLHRLPKLRMFSSEAAMERSTIKDARAQASGARVALGGWVKSVRKHKSVNFINFSDGSCLAEMQVTLPAPEESDSPLSNEVADVADVTVGSSIFVEGVLRDVPGGKQKKLELHPDKLHVLGKCDAQTYPLQKKYHSLEFLRENLHLRARTNTFGAVTRVRNALRYVSFSRDKYLFLE
jgi:aspartyl/asparaginyl-tRNA synthetase